MAPQDNKRLSPYNQNVSKITLSVTQRQEYFSFQTAYLADIGEYRKIRSHILHKNAHLLNIYNLFVHFIQASLRTNRHITLRKRLFHTCVEHGGLLCGRKAPLVRHLLRTSGVQTGRIFRAKIYPYKSWIFCKQFAIAL